MNTTFTNYDQLPLALNADEVAQVLGISRAGAYSLMHAKNGIPVLKVGKRLVVPKDKLLAWIDQQVAS